jgi:predicted lipid-binding transport protein (Tim44 family)
MWLYMIAGAMIVLGLILAFAGGGIFSIVLIPLGLIALCAAAFTSFSALRKQRAEQGGPHASDPNDPTEHPLPHSLPRDTGRTATSPEGLADARRAQQ